MNRARLKPKKRKCRMKAAGCEVEFWPGNYDPPMRNWCRNNACVDKKAGIAADKQIAKKRSISAREKKATRERLKTRSEWIKDAQVEFNKFIRIRDKDLPCISCGRFDYEIEDRFTGGKWDAGHFKTRGGFPELRFTEDNCHRQCKSCNQPGPIKATKVQIQYRKNLVANIGLRRVEILEGPNIIPKWTIEELKEIKLYYREKAKSLSK